MDYAPKNVARTRSLPGNRRSSRCQLSRRRCPARQRRVCCRVRSPPSCSCGRPCRRSMAAIDMPCRRPPISPMRRAKAKGMPEFIDARPAPLSDCIKCISAPFLRGFGACFPSPTRPPICSASPRSARTARARSHWPPGCVWRPPAETRCSLLGRGARLKALLKRYGMLPKKSTQKTPPKSITAPFLVRTPHFSSPIPFRWHELLTRCPLCTTSRRTTLSASAGWHWTNERPDGHCGAAERADAEESRWLTMKS